ncbi:MAG: ABC transporter ATP-binding protein, partial [Bdellovibrionales bacterium]|nr:ABC transporter ATP-binding protein [Bdellovibrionales bacterium]
DPEVILFDEPTTGLDPHVRQDFWALVLELKKEGKAILLTTHYMDEASRLCDRLILLQKGEIVGEGAPKEIVSEVIGDEVVEIIGPSHEGISQALGDTDIWIANFSDGYLIALPRGDADLILERLLQLPHKQYTRRASNLDDVFIRLTGGKLTGLRQDFVL